MLTIDQNKNCKRCGKPGAVNGQICMKCLLKAIKFGEFDHILKKKETK